MKTLNSMSMKTLIPECPYTELETHHKYIIQRKQGNKYVYLEGVFYDVTCSPENLGDNNVITRLLRHRNRNYERNYTVPGFKKNIKCGSIIEKNIKDSKKSYCHLTFVLLKKVNISESIKNLKQIQYLDIKPGDIPPPPAEVEVNAPQTPPGTPPSMSSRRIQKPLITCIISVKNQVMPCDIELYKVEDFKTLLKNRIEYFERTSKNIIEGKTKVDDLSELVSDFLRPKTGGKSRKHKRIHRNRTIKRM